MNKILTFILIILLSVVTIGLSIFLYFMINGKINFKNIQNFKFDNVSNNLVDSKEISTLKDLDIKTDVVDISIEESDINNIKVELYSDNPKYYEITENENNLKVVLEEKNRVGFNFFRKIPKVIIHIPSNYNKNIVVNSSVGDVKIDNFPYATLNAKLDVGDLKIKHIKNATANLRIGDIKIDNINKLTTDLKTGDVKIQNIKEINAKVKTGDVKINSLNGYVNITSNTGDVKIQDAIIYKNSKIDSRVGDVKINNIKGCYINAKTRIGDTKVDNKERKSEIELNIKNDIGDIKVN